MALQDDLLLRKWRPRFGAFTAARQTVSTAPRLRVDSVAQGQVTLSWTPAGETAVAGYRLLWGETANNFTQSVDVGTGRSYTVTELENNRSYYFAVAPYAPDTTPYTRSFTRRVDMPDTLPPGTPTNLSASLVDGVITLSWTLSASEGVIGQRVYRSDTTGGPYTEIAELDALSTSYVDTDSAGDETTYFYVLTAFDGALNESVYSQEISASTSGPPFVSNPIPDVTAQLGDSDVTYDLSSVFADPEGSELTVHIIGTPVSASIDPDQVTLRISFAQEVSETVTIRATDPAGLYVDEVFSVDVVTGGVLDFSIPANSASIALF